MKFKYITTVFRCFLLAGCMVLAATCNKNGELDTNQLSGREVALKSFGPCPIARGAELRIIGTNLDRVESVTIPGAPAITNINRISKTEIRVTVPQTAEQGKISLKAGKQTIVSITEISYSEPVSISRITPAEVKPGTTTIKIEGEYLNLMKEVIFVNADLKTNHVLQADFISQSRQAIELKVPLTAQTGKMIISNGADLVPEGENPGIPLWIYSEKELNVILPAFANISPKPVKPESELTITGTNLDLVKFLRFGDSNIEVTGFIINEAKTEIKAVVPQKTEINAIAGKGNLKLIAFSGVEVTYDDLKLVAPVITGISPNPAKNRETLTIHGTNLDLVTSVTFAGNVTGAIDSESHTAEKIEVEVPAAAMDGKVTLNTHSGQTAEMDYTLVQPEISSITPLRLTAGDDLTITGTNLDLTVEVIFRSGEGTVSVNLTDVPNGKSFTVRTPFTATGGAVSLKTVNETIVTSAESLTVEAATLPVVTEMPRSVKPGGLLTMKGVNLETVTNIGFYYLSSGNEIPATRFLPDASGEALQVYVPTAKGDAYVRLYVADEYVETGILTIGTHDPVWDESYVFFDFDGKNGWWGSFGSIENDPSLSLDGSNYFRIHQNLTGGWIDFFWRNSADNFKTDGVTVTDWVIKMDVNILGDKTPPFKFRLKGTDGDFWLIFGGLENRGDWYTVSLPLTDFVDEDGTGVNHLPNVQNVNSDFGLALAGEGETNICIDNVRFEPK